MARKAMLFFLFVIIVGTSSAQYKSSQIKSSKNMNNKSGDPAISLGPQLGYFISQDADNGRLLYGAALRLKLNSALGAEGAINYRQEDYGNGDLTVRSWPVTVTALFYPFPIVYGALGAGWYNTTFDYKESLNNSGLSDKTKQLFGWHLGAGVELPIGNSTKLTGDIHYVFLNYNVDRLNTVPVTKIKSNFSDFTIGLQFGL